MSSTNKSQERRLKILNLKKSILTVVSNTSSEKTEDWKKKKLQTPMIPTKRRVKEENLRNFTFLSSLNDLEINRSFESDFQILQKIGQGAHSVVNKCIEKKTQKIYAVKITKKNDIELFHNIRESYQIMKQLSHDYVLEGKYLYISQDNTTTYMVSQLYDYPELRDYMMKNKNMSEKKIASIINKIMEALLYLQQKGVCHRDIKPQNILYNPQTQEIKILDFQLAKMSRYYHEKLDLWSSTGSLHYRAPETFGKGYSQQIDIWSAGVIAYEMLASKLPFNSKYEHKIAKQIRQKELDFDSLKISSEAKLFLKKLLQKDPHQRMTPRQAISHPFLLKNASVNSQKKLNSTIDDIELEQILDDENDNEKKCYNQFTEFRFSCTIHSDIGIRYCH